MLFDVVPVQNCCCSTEYQHVPKNKDNFDNIYISKQSLYSRTEWHLKKKTSKKGGWISTEKLEFPESLTILKLV